MKDPVFTTLCHQWTLPWVADLLHEHVHPAHDTYRVWFIFGNRGSNGAVDNFGSSFLPAMTARDGIASQNTLQRRTTTMETL